ncbi:hypothetical protein PCAR4_460139 [Paraburkholderia caribensis]|nr:hypothetical protein PCAR4_460139 [Paraburkholderia caribensis]
MEVFRRCSLKTDIALWFRAKARAGHEDVRKSSWDKCKFVWLAAAHHTHRPSHPYGRADERIAHSYGSSRLRHRLKHHGTRGASVRLTG